MPEIPVGAQIFDVVFHPTFATVYTGLLTGHVKAFAYNEQGSHKPSFSIRPSKSSCRGLSLNQDGSQLYAVGKGKSLHAIDTRTESIDTRSGAHDSTINRVKHLMPWLLSTGDDDGVIKLWDPRQRDCIRTYNQHWDYITDFLWLDDKKQLVATSGDGTLSVMDVRSKKSEPISQSEDQEDELLSIVSIKGASKVVVGTQLGILSVFNRTSGWGDCVDRVPGHPLSVDALCSLPSDLPNVDSTSTILTGSSDGYVRAVQILPTKLIGVVADHGEWPIERISIGGGVGQLSMDLEDDGSVGKSGQSVNKSSASQDDDQHESEDRRRQWWVGSVGHDETLRMTDLEGFFREARLDEDGKGALGVDARDDDSDIEEDDDANEGREEKEEPTDTETPEAEVEEADSDDESDSPQPKKRKRKPEKDPLNAMKKQKGKNSIAVERSFFDEL
ncbi:WD40-repeat-containing domain protein [Crassisporium funariophilum]|nr:WD40-repeat-containing domain protein [Crassisporium funariophilum]